MKDDLGLFIIINHYLFADLSAKEELLSCTSCAVLPLQVLITEMSKVYKNVSTEIMFLCYKTSL